MGVPFTSSSLGHAAAQAAVNKAKFASGAVLNMLARAGCDSWGASEQLYESMITSTLLYGVVVWGLRYLDQIEKAQMNFYKRLLHLPSYTPNWCLRLELGIVKIAHKAMRLTWNWFIKILKLPDKSLPKLCMIRLIALANSINGINDLNWATQFRAFLIRMNCQELLYSRDPVSWAAKTEEVFQRFKVELVEEDLVRWRESRACQFRMPTRLEDGPARYLTLKLPLRMKRVIAQLRVSSQYCAKITYAQCAARLDPHQICQNCNLSEEETVVHFFCKCPLYSPYRAHYLKELIRVDMLCKEALEALLDCADVNTLKTIYYFVGKSLQIRAFSLNQ